jgi:uncharacterized protein (TIGR00369 family)
MDMAISEPLRERVVRWDDPKALALAGRSMSGRAFLEAMRAGELPPPPVCNLVDFTISAVDDGRVDMVLTPHEAQYNPIGSVHGGVIATVLDSVMGCAVHSLLPVGRGYTTLEIKVNYLRAITRETGTMRATGKVIHLGGRTAMAEASLNDARGRLFAQATTTCLVFDLPTDAPKAG